MNMKKITVSVGIPALNEEGNIKKLLLSVLSQEQKSYKLEKIIVVSDGSTDRTVEEINSVKSQKIIVIENKKRIGQALSQNKIIKINISEILVLLNADVLPKNKKFIDYIVAPIIKNSRVGLVGAKVEPVGSETFIGRVIDFSAEIKNKLYRNKNKGNNIYNCHGRARAFSKAFLMVFNWEKTVAEDAYSYLSCLNAGYSFVYQPNAIVLYKSPQTVKDHMRQSVRFIHSQTKMKSFFDENFVREQYFFSRKQFLSDIFMFLLKKPHLFISYSIIYIWAEISSRINKMTSVNWEVSESSKVVAR